VTGRTTVQTPAERAAALPRFADDVAVVQKWTGWGLDSWRL
jgi:hypothetical protein